VRKAGIAGSNDPAPEGSGNMTSLEFVRKLVAKGANVNSLVTKRPPAGVTELNMIGGTPLFLAARTADAELMQLLVDLGADPSLRNADETTTLMAAAGVGTRAPGEDPGTESEMVEAVKLALDLGNNVNSVDKNGETAMHGAAAKFAASIVQLLAANGAKSQIWNQKNKKGYTPLSIAQGVQRGMNVVGHPATADAIRKALADDSLVR
jgi:ankyrin repeat protein